MKFNRLFIHTLIRKYLHDEMSVYAAQASFFIMLAVFPFFMLLLCMINMIPFLQESDLLEGLAAIFPDNLDALLITILHDVQTYASTALLSASAFTALWSSSKGMLSIERALNKVYGIDVSRNYFFRRLVCSGYTLLYTCFCAIILVFWGINSTIMIFFSILSFYVILPYKKQSVIQQIPGTLFTTVGWIAFSQAFSFYFRHFNNYHPMYGSLTTIILLLLWLYFGFCILFIGAEINSILHIPQNKNSH